VGFPFRPLLLPPLVKPHAPADEEKEEAEKQKETDDDNKLDAEGFHNVSLYADGGS
jgi:hypothetical protein